MAHILIMPRQGNTVESCIIVDWKIKEGDEVKEDTTACEVETDKATFEIPAGFSGKVLKILHAAGDDVPVLSPIAVIGAAGENWQDSLESTSRDAEPSAGKMQNNKESDLPSIISGDKKSVENISQVNSQIKPCGSAAVQNIKNDNSTEKVKQ